MRKIIVLLLIVLISGCTNDRSEGYYVTKVIDGDTFVIATGEHVRLQGIDAPDKHDYYYEESTERLRELVEFKHVALERDITDKDRYGRLLRYAYLGNRMINAQMLEEGYASLFVFENDRKYENILTYAEKSAKGKHLGIWSHNGLET